MNFPLPLRLYVDPRWKQDGAQPTPILFPFWGNPYGKESQLAKEAYDAHPLDTRYYCLTETLADAHMVLVPYRQQWIVRHGREDLLRQCERAARSAHIPLLLDGQGDMWFSVTTDNTYVLRIDGYRFLPEKNRIIIPTSGDDLLERCAGGTLAVREKGDTPSVSFAGWADLPLKQTIRTMIKELPIRARALIDSKHKTRTKGVFWRKRALRELSRSPLVTSNFLVRSTFSGSSKTAQGDLAVLRQEFVDNILGSDYGLAVRGDPNISTRLFEVCSLGRIPLLLDTQCVLPFETEINYRNFCVIVDYRDIRQLPEHLAQFHKNISPERFKEMQRIAREMYVTYFRLDAIMPHIIDELARLGFHPMK